jgi:hypothetical protein
MPASAILVSFESDIVAGTADRGVRVSLQLGSKNCSPRRPDRLSSRVPRILSPG